MQLATHTIYEFDFTDKITFGDVPKAVLYEMFHDGRFCSEPLAYTFQSFFDDLVYVDRKGYDFVHPEFQYIEQKQVTRSSGLKFCESSMIGVGRSVDAAEVQYHIVELDLFFLIPDITNFPLVRVILLPGSELLEKCSNNSASFTVGHAQQRLFKPYATES